MYALIRKLLFSIDPEKIHYMVMNRLRTAYGIPLVRRWMRRKYTYDHPGLQRTLWGIPFPNPVGLAAGFDKDARFINELACLGFGFVEIGTLTPLPQPGNPKPRLFRLPADKALVNRMGFNNQGVDAAALRLKNKQENIIIGGNIGKNKLTPNEDAVSDYEKCFRSLYDVVDYFVVNVSSPNTPGLRELQEKEPLTSLLNHLSALNKDLGSPKPLLLEIAPDLTDTQLDDIIDIVTTTGIQGIVATNTTIARDALATPARHIDGIGAGGLSGMPLRERSTEVIRYITDRSKGAIPVIAVGGIFTARDAREKLNAGAALVQVYTGFVYEGPAIASAICRELAQHDLSD